MTPPAAGGSSGLLQGWLEALLKDKAAADITSIEDDLRKDLEKTWEELQNWVMRSKESDEIQGLCADVAGSWGGGAEKALKEMCKGVAEIRYFISGADAKFVGRGGVRDDISSEELTPDKAYARCIVGAVALNELYGYHCYLGNIIKKVQTEMEGKLRGHLEKEQRGGQLNKCKNIDLPALMFGKSILQEKIKQWADTERVRRTGGPRRMWLPWSQWPTVCKEQKSDQGNLQQQRKENAPIMTSFLQVGDDSGSSSSTAAQPSIQDVLVNDAYTIPQEKFQKALSTAIQSATSASNGAPGGIINSAELTKAIMENAEKESKKNIAEVCMKNSTKFCDRLKCAKQYWELKEGRGSSSNDFWSSNVRDKLNSLFSNTLDNGSTTDAYCSGISGSDNANKEACKHMAKLLNQMYQNSDGSSDKYSDQIIKCALLKAYAKKLKEKAEEKGFCSIESGLKEAFKNSKTIMGSASDQCTASNTNNCFECNWTDNTDDDLKSCTIPNGNGQDEVKDNVVKLFPKNDKTKDTEIHKTLTDFNNKNPLCERLQCLASRVQLTMGSKRADDFWKLDSGEVAKLWKELSTAMTNNGTTISGTDCDNVNDANSGSREATHSEKTACKFLHAGLKQLYGTPSPSGDDVLSKKYPSFRQTMGCFLLHAYAQHMKEKAVCDIDGGISKAFNAWQDLSRKAPDTCNGSDKICIPCKWEEEQFGKCTVDGHGTGQNDKVEDKLKDIVKKDDSKIVDMAKEVNNVTELCDQVQCVAARWRKHDKNKEKGIPRNWDNVWKAIPNEVTSLSEALKEATTENKRTEFEKYCNGLQGQNGKEVDKEACLLIAAGLKSLYDINDKDDINASFQRTMRCVLLNSIADKLEKEEFPCKEERSVTEGINWAFNTKNDEIKQASEGCKDDNVKCFTCVRERNLMNCTLNNDDKNVKEKVEPMLDQNATLKKESLEKTICKPCTEDKSNPCQQLQCIGDKWKKNRVENNYDKIGEEFKTELTKLLGSMKSNQDNVGTYCNQNISSKDWETGAAGDANRTACQLVAAGLEHISKIKRTHNPGPTDEEKNPYDNQEFHQVASCLMLNAVVKEMKKRSKICNIDEGIRTAFAAAPKIRTKHCNREPCIECTLTDKYDECSFDKEQKEKVKPKLEAPLTEEEANVQTALSPITDTPGNKGPSLCKRLQCLSSRVEASGQSTAKDFWEKNGDVGKLWTELSTAMTKDGKTDQNGCDQMYDNGSGTGGTPGATRQATNPEKRACNYLYVGLNQLYNPPTTGTPPSTGTNILSEHQSLRHTVGCFLLKEYAKKMEKESKCVINSGLKKAFGTAGKNLIGGQCKWDDEDYGKCTITTSGTNGKTEQTPVKNKLDQVKNKIEGTAKEILPKINEMNKLCDYIRCAGPKWFKNRATPNGNSGGTPTPTKNWCDFWDTTVKDALKKMFDNVASEGGKKVNNSNTTICQQFGDGNEDSVERKACNHITAGLKYISEAEGVANGGTQIATAKADDKFFKQTMMCAALNLYATKIRDELTDKCPIDESKIQDMFTKWNLQNNKSSSSCNGGGSTNVCFECQREENFGPCNLLVDKDLIAASSSGGNEPCNNNDNRKEVKNEINNLLESKDNNSSQSNPNSTIKSNIGTTLTTITEMASSFCTQLQCAIKKKLKSRSGQATSSGTTQPWNTLKTEIVTELTALLNNMNDATKQKEVEQYCKNDTNWNNKGHTERRTNRAACLHFAAGLQHIYGRPNGQKKGQFNGPSFGQTMGCLFLKEYAKQLKVMADKEKKYKVHPLCEIDKGIDHAFSKSEKIMKDTSPCNKNGNSCFECKWNDNDYDDCKIGNDKVKTNVETLFKHDENKKHMQQTLENTVCPILLTDILTPFLPLAPVSIGLSAMAYYLWKYFGPLGKGGARFRRSPAEIPGSSVQEQVLGHVHEGAAHEYQLVKERKPRSAPTRTKRSGPVNRRTIIEIHFEVLDECQKGDTQLNQKDFLELLVQEFMGSEFMEEEQVPMEEVLMEAVPMESIPMERVPNLGSGLLV
ncbi:SICAvar, type I [Plasmodium knowlesi strain H]|uniref:SICAvar, type I n=3 Tax=Plasmodium knowlesi TaxID=5850 RepID=A0A5E7X2P8_PLAKH|nr:SICAvar, type I [Plasmodium knowlesi strain H]OTN66987.1 SICAvar type I [Plasmodium knowlesi]CAA9988648.1 SICAvar, type I [Plasmodium knowlesi strain H]SBO21514.1 SICAvar, type I [Plasmodium knowlesi strain H]SBO21922.1 SICAvar, type I [Plasmodium knowlesi strain H]VVS78122.1 SICAvar, type I [Plasmodium knowlesi strain H]